MKNETKILIVALIMILSMGPVSYFFSGGPTQIELPDNEELPTAYFLSGNITSTIMDLEPYINFVGIGAINSKEYAVTIIESIPEIENYSIEVSLNPKGAGYQYKILVPVNDTLQIKRIGFRLAWRFSKFFEQRAGSIPLVFGTVQLPPEFELPTEYGPVNVTTKNQTVKALLSYTKQPGVLTRINCEDMTTSLNYILMRTPSLCYDTDLFVNQEYLGLSLMDILFIPTYELKMNLEATAITGVEFQGKYKFANISSVSIPGLESETNSTIYLVPEDNDRAGGNFTIRAPFYSTGTVNYIRSVFEQNNFTIEKQYREAYIAIPPNVTIDGKTYEIYKTSMITGKIGIIDDIGFHNFNVSINVIYDEITYIGAKRTNLP